MLQTCYRPAIISVHTCTCQTCGYPTCCRHVAVMYQTWNVPIPYLAQTCCRHVAVMYQTWNVPIPYLARPNSLPGTGMLQACRSHVPDLECPNSLPGTGMLQACRSHVPDLECPNSLPGTGMLQATYSLVPSLIPSFYRLQNSKKAGGGLGTRLGNIQVRCMNGTDCLTDVTGLGYLCDMHVTCKYLQGYCNIASYPGLPRLLSVEKSQKPGNEANCNMHVTWLYFLYGAAAATFSLAAYWGITTPHTFTAMVLAVNSIHCTGMHACTCLCRCRKGHFYSAGSRYLPFVSHCREWLCFQMWHIVP